MMVSVLPSYVLAVTVILNSVPASSGDIILDTNADLAAGWTNRGCMYARHYDAFYSCHVTVTGDDEMNDDYWSFCTNSACRLTYTVQDEDDPITAINIRAYVVPNDAVVSPVIRVTYIKDDEIHFTDFPIESGWLELNYEFPSNLGPGFTIEVRQTGFYENGKDFSMVDRIILSNGLEESTTVAPTTFRTTTEETGIQCPPEGIVFLSNPTDCSKFYICADGEAFPEECDPGLLFDHELGACNIASEIQCEIIPDCQYQDGISFMPIVGTCQKYLICADGEGTVLECLDSTEFSVEAGKCVLAFEHDCPYT